MCVGFSKGGSGRNGNGDAAAPSANVMQFANAPMDSNFNWLLCSLDLRFKTNPSTHDPLSQHATIYKHTFDCGIRFARGKRTNRESIYWGK